MPKNLRTALALVLVVGASACAPRGAPVDLLQVAEDTLSEAAVAGRNRAWILGQAGKTQRFNDVSLRTLPASPPSRLRLSVDLPRDGQLSFY